MSSASRTDFSLEMPVEVVEDIAEELEDFVYVSRLGCIEDAQKQYHSVLAKHEQTCFPIVAEFADMLIATEQDDEAYEFLQRFLWHNFGDEFDKQNFDLMRGMLDLVETRLTLKNKSPGDPPSVLTQTPVPRMKQIILEGMNGDFAAIEYHRLEILLMKGVCLAPHRVRIRYTELCRPLVTSKRYWEALTLLDISVAGTDDLKEAYNHFTCFFESITPHLSSQPAKSAQLAALVNYLDFIKSVQKLDASTITKLVGPKIAAEMLVMPQQAIDQAEALLEYFFENLQTARGLLFDRWHALATHFVDQERDKLIAETIQANEDYGTGQGQRTMYSRPGKGRPLPPFDIEALDDYDYEESPDEAESEQTPGPAPDDDVMTIDTAITTASEKLKQIAAPPIIAKPSTAADLRRPITSKAKPPTPPTSLNKQHHPGDPPKKRSPPPKVPPRKLKSDDRLTDLPTDRLTD